MDALSQLIVQGSPAALNLVRSLLNTPMLINTGFVGDARQGLPFAIPLETEDHSQQGSAQVSESLVITANKKVSVADNVAPGSWEWSLSGYIPGITALEPSNYFTPFVRLNTNLLKNAFKQGYVLIFKDVDAAIYTKVVIKQLTIRTQADSRNKTPFTMTLKEINTITTRNTDETQQELLSNPTLGTILGDALNAGSTIAVNAATDAAALVSAIK